MKRNGSGDLEEMDSLSMSGCFLILMYNVREKEEWGCSYRSRTPGV